VIAYRGKAFIGCFPVVVYPFSFETAGSFGKGNACGQGLLLCLRDDGGLYFGQAVAVANHLPCQVAAQHIGWLFPRFC
jgi:hypothetical protein